MNASSLAKALRGNLTQRQEECPLDRLTAMGLGSIGPERESHLNSLGVSLIAFKYAKNENYLKRATSGLADALMWRKVRSRLNVASQAIGEWVHDGCDVCRGARLVFNMEGVSVACLRCNGVGRKKYSDEERSYIPARDMGTAHSFIALAVFLAIRNARERLAP